MFEILIHPIEWAWFFGTEYYFAMLQGSLPVRVLGGLLWPLAALWTLIKRVTN